MNKDTEVLKVNVFAYLWILLAAVLWGTTGTAQSFIEGTAHPLTIGAWRLSLAGFSLLLFVILTGKLDYRSIPWPATFLAALSMALFQPFFFSAVQTTGIAIGTVVAIGSAPVIAGLIEWKLMRRKPGRTWVYATSLAILGCVLLFSDKEALNVDGFGILLALGAGLAFATYAIVSKKVLDRMEAVPAVSVIFSVSALFLLPFLLILDTSYIASSLNISIILYLGLAATSLAYILFSTGLQRVASSSAVTLSLAEPLTAALLGVFLVGEVLSGISWIGVGMLLAGILVLTTARKKTRLN